MGEAKRKKKHDFLIADVVRNIYFDSMKDDLGVGSCMMRSLIGWWVLQRVGFDASIGIGSMVYRIGPDPRRDVISFAGKYNAASMFAGIPLFHTWNEVGSDIVDFSVGDWRDIPDESICMTAEELVTGVKLGPPRWTINPPEPFWWRSARDLREAWKSNGTPDLGHAWYGPITHDLAECIALQFFTCHQTMKNEIEPFVELMLRQRQLGELYPLPEHPRIRSSVIDVTKLEAALKNAA